MARSVIQGQANGWCTLLRCSGAVRRIAMLHIHWSYTILSFWKNIPSLTKPFSGFFLTIWSIFVAKKLKTHCAWIQRASFLVHCFWTNSFKLDALLIFWIHVHKHLNVWKLVDNKGWLKIAQGHSVLFVVWQLRLYFLLLLFFNSLYPCSGPVLCLIRCGVKEVEYHDNLIHWGSIAGAVTAAVVVDSLTKNATAAAVTRKQET